MTTPISGTSGTTATAPAAKTPETGLGQDAFMKLLVAQLKYQNPMAPADGQQFMTQMTSLTTVEKLGQLVTAQTETAYWQRQLSAEGMVGKQVTGETTTAEGATEVVTGTVTGVRFDPDGPVLELSDGRTLSVDAVTRATVVAAATTSTTTSTATATG